MIHRALDAKPAAPGRTSPPGVVCRSQAAGTRRTAYEARLLRGVVVTSNPGVYRGTRFRCWSP